MPFYRRAHVPGGTLFFTLVTERRAPILCVTAAREALHAAIADCRTARPFDLHAVVLLPDHMHIMLQLPEDDADFSTRIAAIKAGFTRRFLESGGVEQERSGSKVKKRRRGVWQRWFWEHVIRDTADFNRHLNYIHYNPVKHGHATCPHLYPYSTFDRWVAKGVYDHKWQCNCDSAAPKPPDFGNLPVDKME